jgi:hypothetical protein
MNIDAVHVAAPAFAPAAVMLSAGMSANMHGIDSADAH